ncbi:MAG: PLDc_N domain-containing protein [Acetobacteraceae bacterium]|nr:PLDc_N domain-containing protein [Acetobacteraceae bacterium]
MLFNNAFSFGNFLLDVFTIFMFILWLWLLITVISDLFRRHDVSGFGKAIWVIALVVFPYLAVLIYLISQSRVMAERNAQRAQQAREDLRHAVGFSVADEIEKLERLQNAGTISSQEYGRLRARIIQ